MHKVIDTPELTRDEVKDLAYGFLKKVSARNLLYVKERARQLEIHPSEFLNNIINASRERPRMAGAKHEKGVG